MKTYLILFYTTDRGNGYAIVNACKPEQASLILHTLGTYMDYGYHITSIKELPISYGLELTVVQEGISTHGLSAYEIAVQEGYTGTQLEWILSLSKPTEELLNLVTTALNNTNNSITKAELATYNAIQVTNNVNNIKEDLQLKLIEANNTINSVSNTLLDINQALSSVNSNIQTTNSLINLANLLNNTITTLKELLLELESNINSNELTRVSQEESRLQAESVRITNDSNRLVLLVSALNAAQQAAISALNAELYVNSVKKGEVNGIASLDDKGRIPWSLMPFSVIYSN